MFYTYKNINLTLNNQSIFVSDLEISQEADIITSYAVDDRVSFEFTPQNPVKSNLKISYYLTGKDPLKSFIYSDENDLITGQIAGLNFSSGFLDSYSINCVPHNPVKVSANILFIDPLNGTFNPIIPFQSTYQVLRFSDAVVNNQPNYTSEISNNIIGINFNYKADIKPVYSIESGQHITNIYPSRVTIGKRDISTQIIFDNLTSTLPFTGKQYGLNIYFVNPSNTGIQETFACSGLINQKTMTSSEGQMIQGTINIIQSHVNTPPIITAVNSNPLSLTGNSNFILNITGNNLLNTYEVDIADRKCQINSITNTGVNITVPSDVIAGNIILKNTKGLATSPFIQSFNYSGIIINGTNIQTGNISSMVFISGLNFNRISNVLFYSGMNAQYEVLGTTGILTVVPPNAISGPIQIISQSRNLTGNFNYFYVTPNILSLNPATGLWGDTISIAGTSFTGIQSVLFNNIPSPSFNVIGSTKIQAIVPKTGAGYTKGYVTVLTSGGLSGQSYYPYEPNVPIFNVYPISGKILSTGSITLDFDKDFLYKVNISGMDTGYLISYNFLTGIFYMSGNNQTGLVRTLTGLVPSGFAEGYVTAYQPDGVTTYPSFTGMFIQIGPAPVVEEIQPYILLQYQSYKLNFKGKYLFDFFNQPYYVQLTNFPYTFDASGATGIFEGPVSLGHTVIGNVSGYFNQHNPFIDISPNIKGTLYSGFFSGFDITAASIITGLFSGEVTIWNKLTGNFRGYDNVNNISLTGHLTGFLGDESDNYYFNNISGNVFGNKAFTSGVRIISGASGWYDLIMFNAAGLDYVQSGIFMLPPQEQAKFGIASHPINSTYANPAYPLSSSGINSKLYSATFPFSGHRSGEWVVTLGNTIDISKVLVYQNKMPSLIKMFGTGTNLINTINLEFYDNNGGLVYSGVPFNTSGQNVFTFFDAPLQNVRQMRIYNSGIPNPIKPYYLGFNDVEIY